MNLREYLLMEDEKKIDVDVLSGEAIGKIRGNIRKGAKAQDEEWRDAIHLTNKAYEVAELQVPHINMKEAWEQYTENLAFAVKQLQTERPHTDGWRISPPKT
jgi:ribosomal protein S10